MRNSPSIAAGDARFGVPIKRLFLICTCLLAPLTAIKFAELQSVELFGIAALGILAATIFRNRLRISGDSEVIRLTRYYALFFVIVVTLALWALRLRTYPIPGTPFLKHAPFLSIARIIQLALVTGTLLVTANLLALRPSLCALLSQCYVYAGVFSASFGIASRIALLAGIHLGGVHIGGTYDQTYRIEGFFNEGGPFGVYLVSVVLICLFRKHILHRGDPRAYWVQLLILFLALVGSQSKAAVLLGIIIAAYFLFLTKRLRYGVALLPAFVILALFSHLPSRLEGYAQSYLNFAKLAQEHPHDVNLIEGRVMAAILVPIMVEHHPIAGIGIGNYSLQRNNPKYLGTLPRAITWDLPGLGLLGDSAEFGIPLLLYIFWLLWRPVSISRRMVAPPLVVLIGAYQTFAHTLGVQLTFVYPWIVSAIALGYSLALTREPNSIEVHAKVQ